MFIAGAMLTKPAHAFSALQALLMAASAGIFSHLVDADFILDQRVVGGLQQVPLLLAERLGDDVLPRPAGAHAANGPTPTAGPERGVTAVTDDLDGARARYVDRSRSPPILYQPHLVRAAAAAPAAADAPAHLDGLRHQGARRLRDAVLARAGPVGHRVQPVRARRTRPTTTPTTATRAARSSASSPTSNADDVFSLIGRGAQGAHPRVALALLRRAGEAPGRLLRERLGLRGVDARRVRRELRPRRPRTATAPTCARPSVPIHFACSDMAGAGYQHVDGAIRMGASSPQSHIIEEARRMSGRRIVVGYTATDAGADARGPRRAAGRAHPGRRSTSWSCCPARTAASSRPPTPATTGTSRSRRAAWLAEACEPLDDPGSPCRTRTHVRYARVVRRGARRRGARVRRVAHRRRRRQRRAARPASRSARSRTSCCTPPTCRSCSRRRAPADRARRRASPASRPRSARAPARTRCSTRRRRSPAAHGAELRLLSLVTVDLPAERRHGRHPHRGRRCTPTRCSLRRATRPARRHRRRGGRRPRRQHRGRRRAPRAGSRRDRHRRLEPARAAPPPVPRLDRCEDAA